MAERFDITVKRGTSFAAVTVTGGGPEGADLAEDVARILDDHLDDVQIRNTSRPE